MISVNFLQTDTVYWMWRVGSVYTNEFPPADMRCVEMILIFLWWVFVQVLVVPHIELPRLPVHPDHPPGPVRKRHLRWLRWTLRNHQHLRWPNDSVPRPHQHPPRCLRRPAPSRHSGYSQLLHQPQLPLHAIPSESCLPRRPGLPAIGRSHGHQLRERQQRLRQAQLISISHHLIMIKPNISSFFLEFENVD